MLGLAAAPDSAIAVPSDRPRGSITAAGEEIGLGYRATSTTTHPGVIARRRRDPRWRLTRAPALANAERGSRFRHAVARLTAGFTYVGPGLPAPVARRLVEDRP